MKITLRETIALVGILGILITANPLAAQCCQCYCWVSPDHGEHCVYTGFTDISGCELIQIAER